MRVKIDIVASSHKDESSSSSSSKDKDSSDLSTSGGVKRKAFIEVHKNQWVWMLKTFIFGTFGIPPAKQKLYLKCRDNDQPRATAKEYLTQLQNYRQINHYPIEDSSEIVVEIQEKENPTDFLVLPQSTAQQQQAQQQQQQSQQSQTQQQTQLQQSQSSSKLSSSTADASSAASGNNKVHVLTTSKKSSIICPALCFAIGKGLYRGISGLKYEIKLYRVSSKGVLINSTSNSPFQIDIIKEKPSDNRRLPFIYEQRRSDHSLLTLSPQSFGEYSISIKIDDTHICGSPFKCTIIDEHNPNLKELAFSNEWIEETVELITLISQRDATLDNLFTFGIENLLNLMFYPDDPTVQIHIAGILSKLLEFDKNKERILRENGIEFFFKVVSQENWKSFPELRRFISCSISALITNRTFLYRFFQECDINIIALLCDSDHLDCVRSCAIALCQLSENPHTEYSIDRFPSEDVKKILTSMLSSKDYITRKCALRAISNPSTFSDTKKETTLTLLNSLLDLLKSHHLDSSLRVLVFKAFSKFCRYAYVINNGTLLELIIPSDPNHYVEIPMFYQWQSNILEYFADSSSSVMTSYKELFSEESELTFFLSLTISNMLDTKASVRIHERFSQGNGLALLKQFVLCHDSSTRAEAFRSFMLMSLSPNDQCKKNLIQNGIVGSLMSSLQLIEDEASEVHYIINSISNLCDFDRTCAEAIGSQGVDRLLNLLTCQVALNTSGGATAHLALVPTAATNPNNALSAQAAKGEILPLCNILAHIAGITDKYNTRIINSAPKVIHYLLQLAKEKRRSILNPISQQEIVLNTTIGRGVSANVYKGVYYEQTVAVKCYDPDNLGFDERDFHNEATMLTLLEHENIIRAIGGSQQPGKLFIVFDYFPRGSLSTVINSKDLPLSTYKIVHIALQTAKGMAYLHSHGIIHRDLKSSNLLIDNNWNLKICDFGVSRITGRRMTRGVGSSCYMAVEVLQGAIEYTPKVDVYSFGVLLWECFSREIPYRDKDQITWSRMVLEENYRLPIPDNCPPEFSALIQKCWATDPKARPTFDEILVTLQEMKDNMETSGIYETFEASQPLVQQNQIGSSLIANENKVHDLSQYATEELKNPQMEEVDAPTMGNAVPAPTTPDQQQGSPTDNNKGEKTTPPSAAQPPRGWRAVAPDRQSKRSNPQLVRPTYTTSPITPLSPVGSNTSSNSSGSSSTPILITTFSDGSHSSNERQSPIAPMVSGASTITKTPNTFSNMTTESSGVLSTNDEEYSDNSFLSHTGASTLTVSTVSSRANSTASINDHFHPNFNPSALEGLLPTPPSHPHHHHQPHELTRSPSVNSLNTTAPITAAPTTSQAKGKVAASPLMGTSRATISKFEQMTKKAAAATVPTTATTTTSSPDTTANTGTVSGTGVGTGTGTGGNKINLIKTKLINNNNSDQSK
ncbi:hypothetical protein SAMD00019534_012630 [Acytostelium subglobosum LB1]|uniref:hypothetical protein n=1 Tax=Acytostelium subglobosum LB1 TaxID=1410327 RepID=UPI0006447EE9|nr:hypothetical protein SAMD00019534_012630 [Acytostelium subglobosum LB1]GAM18088.1 hypothetical protein SAMD00019534_012630 [Acytostelium subglobosum LB1]|eukprot:XP_012758684.1 hypothetical protein SAMD00019534_012630 [Acytostelium subglobosum LB1]